MMSFYLYLKHWLLPTSAILLKLWRTGCQGLPAVIGSSNSDKARIIAQNCLVSSLQTCYNMKIKLWFETLSFKRHMRTTFALYPYSWISWLKGTVLSSIRDYDKILAFSLPKTYFLSLSVNVPSQDFKAWFWSKITFVLQDWSIKIMRLHLSDSGIYKCQANSHPPQFISVHLEVVGKCQAIIHPAGPELLIFKSNIREISRYFLFVYWVAKAGCKF